METAAIINNNKVLKNHTSFETAHKVSNYPYGFKLRTDIFFWIETTKGKGDRFCSVTINPKNGQLNKPKKSTYNDFMFLYEDEKGHVHHGVFHIYHMKNVDKQIEFICNEIGLENVSLFQLDRIREIYAAHIAISFGYWIKEISEENKEDFTEWAKNRIKHIRSAEFINIAKFPEYEKESYTV